MRTRAQIVTLCRVCGKPGYLRTMRDRLHTGCAVQAAADALRQQPTAPPPGDFTHANVHGCNGCDAIRPMLNAHGYCPDCAAEQGAA